MPGKWAPQREDLNAWLVAAGTLGRSLSLKADPGVTSIS